jgi:hypothetical protein
MKRWMLLFAGTCFSIIFLCRVDAQPKPPLVKGLKKEIASDRREVAEQKGEMKGSASDAQQDEQRLKEQIQEAVASGDHEKAKQLRAELKALHQQHVQEMKQDKGELRDAQGELRRDTKKGPSGGHPPFSKGAGPRR